MSYPDVTAYLVARDAQGRWHGCAPETSRAAESFRALHEGRGCTVERLAPDEVVALIAPKGQGSAPTVDPPADGWQPRPIDEARLREIHAAVAREFAGREGLDRPVPIAVAAAARYAHEHCELPEPDLGNGWIDLAVARGRPKVEREAQLLLGLPELQRAAALPRRAEPAPPVAEAAPPVVDCAPPAPPSNIIAPAVDPQPAPVAGYEAFLASKLWARPHDGFRVDPAELPDSLFPFQRDLVTAALAAGRYALFADTGLGKTRMQLVWAAEVVERAAGDVLILAPLAVAQQTAREAAALGLRVTICRTQADVRPGINITNYEMLAHFDPAAFVGVVLDESSILKSFSGKTRNHIIAAFARTPYRLACTATPAPNDYTEIGSHAEFLGVMTRVEMLATFFVHDGGDVSEWRLKGHAVGTFWRWVSGWAAAVGKPSDLGYEDGAYALPELVLNRHTLAVEAEQGALFALPAQGLTAQRKAKRESLEDRCRRVAELVAAEPDEPWVVWCELNDEGDLLERLIPGAVQVTGSEDRDAKEAKLVAFGEGRTRVLITKPGIAGFGMNWQHCARTVFAHVTHSFEQFYQALRRFWRFGQTRRVHAHLVFSEAEVAIVDNLAGKERAAQAMRAQMVAHMRFERPEAATARQTDGYTPHTPMTLPTWLGGAA